jgi:hypothetical protein
MASEGRIFLLHNSQRESDSPGHLVVPEANEAGGKFEVSHLAFVAVNRSLPYVEGNLQQLCNM